MLWLLLVVYTIGYIILSIHEYNILTHKNRQILPYTEGEASAIAILVGFFWPIFAVVGLLLLPISIFKIINKKG